MKRLTCNAHTRRAFFLVDPNTYSRWPMRARAFFSFLTDFPFQIEFAMRVHQGASRAKRLDSMTVRVFETEVTYERTVGVDEEFITDEYPHISKSRKNKRDREAEKEGEPELIKELMDKFESPLLWMRVDPELLWIRKINFKQSDFMWVYQLYKDKNVAAQVEAINGLGSIITSSTAQAPASDFHRYLVVRCLSETLDDSHNYHEVRSYAAATLGRCVKENLDPQHQL